jgi:hypothetical protein
LYLLKPVEQPGIMYHDGSFLRGLGVRPVLQVSDEFQNVFGLALLDPVTWTLAVEKPVG